MNEELERKIKDWENLPPRPDEVRFPPYSIKLVQWLRNENFCKSAYQGKYEDFINGRKPAEDSIEDKEE